MKDGKVRKGTSARGKKTSGEGGARVKKESTEGGETIVGQTASTTDGKQRERQWTATNTTWPRTYRVRTTSTTTSATIHRLRCIGQWRQRRKLYPNYADSGRPSDNDRSSNSSRREEKPKKTFINPKQIHHQQNKKQVKDGNRKKAIILCAGTPANDISEWIDIMETSANLQKDVRWDAINLMQWASLKFTGNA